MRAAIVAALVLHASGVGAEVSADGFERTAAWEPPLAGPASALEAAARRETAPSRLDSSLAVWAALLSALRSAELLAAGGGGSPGASRPADSAPGALTPLILFEPARAAVLLLARTRF